MKSGGYFKEIANLVTYVTRRGIAKTEVKNPLQKATGEDYTSPLPDDHSRALTPKQKPMP